MTRPSRTQLRQNPETPGQRVTDDERFIRVGRVGRVSPEVNESERGSDRVGRPEGKEIEVELEPLVLVGIEHV